MIRHTTYVYICICVYLSACERHRNTFTGFAKPTQFFTIQSTREGGHSSLFSRSWSQSPFTFVVVNQYWSVKWITTDLFQVISPSQAECMHKCNSGSQQHCSCLFVFLFFILTGRIFLAPAPTDHCSLALPGTPSPMAIYLFFLLIFSFPLFQ